jgi:hypothetical protein
VSSSFPVPRVAGKNTPRARNASAGAVDPGGVIADGSTVTVDGAGVLSAIGSVAPPEPANTVYAGPATGAASVPTFRSLVAADLPPGVGQFQLISQVTLATAQLTIDFSAIPATFKNLSLVLVAKSSGNVAGGFDVLDLRMNGDAAANYLWSRYFAQVSAMTVQSAAGAQTTLCAGFIPANASAATQAGCVFIDVPKYSGTTFAKTFNSRFSCYDSVEIVTGAAGGRWNNTAAVNELTLLLDSGNTFVAGSAAFLYGY